MTGPGLVPGRTPELMPRALSVCDSRWVLCPRCGHRMKGFHVSLGNLYVRCSYRPPRLGAARPSDAGECGQWVHVLGTYGGLCNVVPITGDEYRELTDTHHPTRSPLEVYDFLGVLSARRIA